MPAERIWTWLFAWNKATQWMYEGLLTLGAVIVLAAGIVVPLTDAIAGTCYERGFLGGTTCAASPQLTATLKPAAALPPTVEQLPAGVTATHPVTATFVLAEPSRSQRLRYVAPTVLWSLLAVSVLNLLLLVGWSLRREPFTRRNYWRLQAIAVLVGGGALAIQTVQSFLRMGLLFDANLDDVVVVDAWLDLGTPLLGALAVSLVAEMFRRGAALREELETVV